MRKLTRPGLLLVLWIVVLLCSALWIEPGSLLEALDSIGLSGLLAWTMLTLGSRWLQALTASIPMRKLGVPLRVTVAFWLGWIRTFANQIVPLSGVVAYLRTLREVTGASYSQLSVLATPQLLLSATALGLMGVLAVLSNLALFGTGAAVAVGLCAMLTVVPLTITLHAATMLRWLPARLGARLGEAEETFRAMGRDWPLIARLIALHAAAIALRGLRLILLFRCMGISLSVHEALLLMVATESTLIVQLTPGGLVVREGAILGGAAMLNVSLDAAAIVAVADRLLVTGITILMTAPALHVLKGQVRTARHSPRRHS